MKLPNDNLKFLAINFADFIFLSCFIFFFLKGAGRGGGCGIFEPSAKALCSTPCPRQVWLSGDAVIIIMTNLNG